MFLEDLHHEGDDLLTSPHAMVDSSNHHDQQAPAPPEGLDRPLLRQDQAHLVALLNSQGSDSQECQCCSKSDFLEHQLRV